MIKEIHFPLYSPDWHQWRTDHIGGSDISAVCAGYDEKLADVSWTPPIKYYLEMIGEPIQAFMGNVPSKMGQFIEAPIIELYRHFDWSISPEHDKDAPLMEMFKNVRLNRRMNRIICRHNYAWDTRIPFMSGSPDGFIYESRGRGILEIKNMTSMEQNRYLNKINPAHMLQCQHNMLCTGAEYCDLIRLIDGTWIDIIRFEQDPEIQQFIVTCASDFWGKVRLARDIKAANGIDQYYDVHLGQFNVDQLTAIGELQALEPDFVGSNAELKWLVDYIKPVEETYERDATPEEINLLQNYKIGSYDKKEAEKRVNIAKATLISEMKGYQVINTAKGYYSYKMTSAGYPKFYPQPKLLEAL